MKPSQLFTKYGAKHTQGSSIRIQLPSVSVCPGCNQLLRGCFFFVFFLMIQFSAESAAKKIYLTSETVCLLKNPSSRIEVLEMWLEY